MVGDEAVFEPEKAPPTVVEEVGWDAVVSTCELVLLREPPSMTPEEVRTT